jgi:hypothetical protein
MAINYNEELDGLQAECAQRRPHLHVVGDREPIQSGDLGDRVEIDAIVTLTRNSSR